MSREPSCYKGFLKTQEWGWRMDCEDIRGFSQVIHNRVPEGLESVVVPELVRKLLGFGCGQWIRKPRSESEAR
jgi:hypothetical protein